MYALAQTISKNVTAMQAEIKEIKHTLQQNCSKSSTIGSQAEKTCYECNEKGHIKPDCPKLKSSTGGKGKHNCNHSAKKLTDSKGGQSSDKKFAKIKALVEKKKTKPLPSTVADYAKLEVKLDGEIVAKIL